MCQCSLCYFIYFIFLLFRATRMAYGSSQASGWFRAPPASLGHSHTSSKLHLSATYITTNGNVRFLTHWTRLSKARDQTHVLMDASQLHFRCTTIGTPIYFIFCLFRAVPVAYGGSQAKGQIGAVDVGLYHSHSNGRFEPHLWPTPQFMAMLDP